MRKWTRYWTALLVAGALPALGACASPPEDEQLFGEDMGEMILTFYWVVFEGDYGAGDDVELQTCGGAPLAEVAYDFAVDLRMEGTGKLLDGRTLNLGGCDCDGGFACFMELGDEFPWGIGSHENALEPFRSIAVDENLIQHGSIFYSPQLDGIEFPDGFGTHDGCVRADDVGWSFEGYHVDLFVALHENYLELVTQLPDEITLNDGSELCTHL